MPRMSAMSDHHGFNYYPYLQPGAEQRGRSQPSYPAPSGENRASCHRQTYSSMTPPTPQYPSAQSAPERPSEVYSNSIRADVMSSRNGGYDSARAGPHSHGTSTPMSSDATTALSSIANSALGTFAHASSLGQDSRSHASPSREGSSMQQFSDYNRWQPSNSYARSSVYGMTGPLANDNSHLRPDSRGGATTRDEARSTELPSSYVTPYTTYASDGHRQTQPDALSQGGSRTAQIIQRPDSAARIAGGVLKTSSRQQPTTSNEVTSNTVRGSEPSQTQPQSHLASKPQNWFQLSNPDQNAPSWIPPTSTPLEKTSNLESQKRHRANAIPVARSSPKLQVKKGATDGEQHGNQPPLETQPPTLDISANGINLGQRTQTEDQYPTTVNPNAIFDNVRYQESRAAAAASKVEADRTAAAASEAEAAFLLAAASSKAEADRRKAAAVSKAEAAARRKAAVASKAEAARKAAEKVAAEKAEAQAEASGNGAASDSASKNQMELEIRQMKQMIEKMRDYKTKDPDLFSEIWELVKKVSAPD